MFMITTHGSAPVLRIGFVYVAPDAACVLVAFWLDVLATEVAIGTTLVELDGKPLTTGTGLELGYGLSVALETALVGTPVLL